MLAGKCAVLLVATKLRYVPADTVGSSAVVTSLLTLGQGRKLRLTGEKHRAMCVSLALQQH